MERDLLLKAKDFEEVVLRPSGRFKSPLNARPWEAWRKASGDPERDLVSWIRFGTPLGMSSDIPYCGIFPMTEDEEANSDAAPEMQLQMEVENYKGFKEEPEHPQVEVQRYLDKGFCVELSESQLQQQFPTGTVSKLALIVKEKEDGSFKRRVIIDLLRSGGNKRCKVRERIVLPRIVDVRDSLKYLRENRFGLILRAQREGWADQEECDEIEMVSVDMAEAYCHLAVCEDELCHCVAPSVTPGRFLVFTAMLFGFRGAPLIMGRFASALARFIQSLMPADELQSQLYIDDPLWMLQGPKWRRQENLALILHSCGALGVKLQFKKGFRGLDAIWIGPRMELRLAEEVLVLSIPPKMMNETRDILMSWHNKGMVPLKEVRTVTGKLSWICGILARARTSSIRGHRTDNGGHELEHALSRRDDSRPKLNLVAVHRMELPRRWFIEMFDKLDKFALRREPLRDVPAQFALVTDASPRGVGAILADI